jgi:hypothetical protein
MKRLTVFRRRQGYGGQVSFRFSVFSSRSIPDWPIDVCRWTAVEPLCLDQLQSKWLFQFREEWQAAPDSNRMNKQLVFIDDSGRHEALREGCTAVSQDIPSRLLLQPGYTGRQIAGYDLGVGPRTERRA